MWIFFFGVCVVVDVGVGGGNREMVGSGGGMGCFVLGLCGRKSFVVNKYNMYLKSFCVNNRKFYEMIIMLDALEETYFSRQFRV